jgi:small multidrug resistance pump
MIYRLIFGLAALYNIGFGIWACFWPEALFASLEMTPPNYPSLWQCLGMVVGLYGVLYAYAAVHLDRGKLIIALGLAGKLLGPIGPSLPSPAPFLVW